MGDVSSTRARLGLRSRRGRWTAARRGAEPMWVRAADGAVEGGILAFAVWTLFYELALLTQWNLWWPARVWILVAAGLVAWRVLVGVRREEGTPAPREPASPPTWNLPVVALVVLLVVLGASRGVVGYLPVVLVGMLLLLDVLARGRRAPAARPATTPSAPAGAHVVAGVASLALGALAMWLRGSSGDDVYYVNRVTWVAERGTPAIGDTMFSAGHLASASQSLPLPSIEAWQGAIAHVLGVQGPTVAFVLVVPWLGAATGWATWRLVRTWAPRRALLVFLIAVLFTVFSLGTVVGSYSFGVIWEGKLPAVTIVIPLVWHHLTRLVTARRWDDLLLLVALGVTFVGLTSAAPLVAVAMAAAGLLAAWLLRSRAAAVGSIAFVVAPLTAGMVQSVYSVIGSGPPQPPLGGDVVFARFFGDGAFMLLGVIGVVLGVRLLREPGRTLAACASLAGLTSVLPGVQELLDGVTGAGAVTWRLPFVIPFGVMVGMLATVRLPSVPALERRHGRVLTAAAPGVVVLAVLLLAGSPLWSAPGPRFRPTQWPVDPAVLSNVRAVEDLETPSGPWLLPQVTMSVFAMTTTRHPTVAARYFYMTALATSDADKDDRWTLLRLVNSHAVRPDDVREALQRLDVALACVFADDERAVFQLRRAVRAPLEEHGTLACHVGLPDSRP